MLFDLPKELTMQFDIDSIEMDAGCTHLEGYSLGFNDAKGQCLDSLIYYDTFKRENDRILSQLRLHGIPKELTKKPSVALAAMISRHQKQIKLLIDKVKELENG